MEKYLRHNHKEETKDGKCDNKSRHWWNQLLCKLTVPTRASEEHRRPKALHSVSLSPPPTSGFKKTHTQYFYARLQIQGFTPKILTISHLPRAKMHSKLGTQKASLSLFSSMFILLAKFFGLVCLWKCGRFGRDIDVLFAINRKSFGNNKIAWLQKTRQQAVWCDVIVDYYSAIQQVSTRLQYWLTGRDQLETSIWNIIQWQSKQRRESTIAPCWWLASKKGRKRTRERWVQYKR